MYSLSSDSVYIGCQEKTIFIPTEGATPNNVLATLLEGTSNMINWLFEKYKTSLLILTMDLS